MDLAEDFEWEDNVECYHDRWTDFRYKKEYDEEVEEVYPFTDVVGILRRGENFNPFVGDSNMPSQSIFQYVDTLYMKGMFSFNNDLDFDDYYLERMVDELEDGDSFPIPATRRTFLQGRGTADVYNGYAKKHGFLSVASFMGVAGLILRK